MEGRGSRAGEHRRLPVGQLLVRLLGEFRRELLAAAAARGYSNIRPAHLHITGNVGTKGIRLTVLAERAQLSLGTTSELVKEMEGMGYLERRPDPSDRRAKLIVPAPRGLMLLQEASQKVEEMEREWARAVGETRLEEALQTLDELLLALRAQRASSGEGSQPR